MEVEPLSSPQQLYSLLSPIDVAPSSLFLHRSEWSHGTKESLSQKQKWEEITPFLKGCLLDFSNAARTSVAALGREKDK